MFSVPLPDPRAANTLRYGYFSAPPPGEKELFSTAANAYSVQ